MKDNNTVPDVNTYELIYSLTSFYTLDQLNEFGLHVDSGYYYINKFINLISHDFMVFIVLYSILIVITNIITLKRYSKNITLSLLLYFSTCYFSFFLLRQYIAISICMITIPYIINQKFKPFVLLTLFASLFHESCLIWLLMFFIYKLRLSYKTLFSIFIVALICILFENILLDRLSVYFPKLSTYQSDDIVNYTWKNMFISSITLLFFIFSIRKKISTLEPVIKLFFMMYFIVFILNCINFSGTKFTAFYRLTPYFSYSLIYLIPYSLQSIKNPIIKIGSFCCFMIMFNVVQISSQLAQRGLVQFVF